MILRRLYLYVVSAAALAALAIGLSALGSTVLVFYFIGPAAQDSRTSLAIWTATALVALPVWAVHFWFARRFAHRDPAERVLRADAASRLARHEATPAPASAAVTAPVLATSTVDAAPIPVATAPRMRFILSVVDATDDDVHQVLANLPPAASYLLTPLEPES
jgi:hypothetical protein